MRRWVFIGVLGATTVGLPLGARAQQTMRRVAVILARRENDPLGLGYLTLGLEFHPQLLATADEVIE